MSHLISSPYLIGFEDIEHMLERLAKAGSDGYPPYNIERVHAADNMLRLRIVLAVAGFDIGELEITLERNRLIRRGAQNAQDDTRVFLHRGIAARQFQKQFVLADGMEISGAMLKNGLLTVELERPVPVEVARKIAIRSEDG